MQQQPTKGRKSMCIIYELHPLAVSSATTCILDKKSPMFSTGLISWIFVCFDIAETILRTRIDGFREKGRTSSHIHLFPISTNSSSHVQNTNTNTENVGQFLISKTKKVCLSPQAVSGNFSSVLALKFWSFVYKLWPYDSFWGEAIECPAYKYVRQ